MSDEKRETISDVLAEMRSGKLSATVECENCGCEQGRRFTFDGLADRIEAAWKRQEQCYLDQIRDAVNMIGHERFVAKHPPVGNTASIREALASVHNWCINKQVGASFQVTVEGLLSIVDAALSAPARNCDMYLTQPEMSRAYEEYRDAAMKRYGIGLTGRVPAVKQKPMTYDEWMLAPAKEEKGVIHE